MLEETPFRMRPCQRNTRTNMNLVKDEYVFITYTKNIKSQCKFHKKNIPSTSSYTTITKLPYQTKHVLPTIRSHLLRLPHLRAHALLSCVLHTLRHRQTIPHAPPLNIPQTRLHPRRQLVRAPPRIHHQRHGRRARRGRAQGICREFPGRAG